MPRRNTALRAVNQLSLGAWFGGSLMGAVALPRAAAHSDQPLEAEGAGWAAWQPVQTAAIVAQLASGAGLTVVNRERVVGQSGVAGASVVRTALTGAALVATVVAARSGRTAEQAVEEAAGDGAAPQPGGGDEAGNGSGGDPKGQRSGSALAVTRAAQWAVPLLTGAMLVLDARMGEQQRPGQVLRGVLERAVPAPVSALVRLR